MANEELRRLELEELLTEFERQFQTAKGFKQRALAEDWERDLRRPDSEKHRPTMCPHGKTKLTCDICYFHNDGGWGWGR